MEKFDVHILGCGSALPTSRHFPTSQVVNLRDKLFMIDCGEGAQLQFRKCKLKFSRLNHIFISHLHGDHCFGLPGLISTLNLLGRTAELHIHAPQELEGLLSPWLAFFCHQMTFKVLFHPFETKQPQQIYEDRSMTVTTIPLKHRMPSCGFLFAEKQRPRHIIREMIDRYDIPLYEINRIKNGADYQLPDGELIPNDRLTTPADAVRRYAYCSDTLPLASVAEQVKGVNLLFHEATFADDGIARAKETYHTTAKQAARLAKEAQVGKLLIGHFSARYEDEQLLLDEAQSVFPNTQLAREIKFYSID
ncbi:MAG: ribonuclease Z [Bacteroides sp.]|nr:ribonuclease Z [Bacteroides sp.]